MKTISHPHAIRRLSTTAALSGLLALSACSAIEAGSSRQPARAHITTLNAAPGKIATVRAFESRHKLYVTGTAGRSSGHAIPAGTHIDIELLGPDGRAIASQRKRLFPAHPRHEQRRGGRYSFTAGFPLEAARQAASIRVSYHPASHS